MKRIAFLWVLGTFFITSSSQKPNLNPTQLLEHWKSLAAQKMEEYIPVLEKEREEGIVRGEMYIGQLEDSLKDPRIVQFPAVVKNIHEKLAQAKEGREARGEQNHNKVYRLDHIKVVLSPSAQRFSSNEFHKFYFQLETSRYNPLSNSSWGKALFVRNYYCDANEIWSTFAKLIPLLSEVENISTPEVTVRLSKKRRIVPGFFFNDYEDDLYSVTITYNLADKTQQ